MTSTCVKICFESKHMAKLKNFSRRKLGIKSYTRVLPVSKYASNPSILYREKALNFKPKSRACFDSKHI
ncbi:hypothetical protein ES703_22563 [subsurface metagenome]